MYSSTSSFVPDWIGLLFLSFAPELSSFFCNSKPLLKSFSAEAILPSTSTIYSFKATSFLSESISVSLFLGSGGGGVPFCTGLKLSNCS